MDISLQIKSLLSQAELYRSQGLFAEAKEKYITPHDLAKKIEEIKKIGQHIDIYIRSQRSE